MTATADPSAALPPAASSASPGGASLLDRALDASDTPFTRWLVRWRRWFFAGLVLIMLAQFNGQWRPGLDTALYRGVADSLAAGHGYKVSGRPQTQIYPGLPVALAAMQRGLGTTSLVPPLVLMNALALLTLVGVYHLIKLRYPLWIAVVVTCGVGLNERFVQQGQEIMTDTPFLAAVVAALLGWEYLGAVRGRGRLIGATALLVVGLFVAATMRPTFWVLAVAWGLVAAWNGLVRRERRSLLALAALVLVGVAVVVLDPRGVFQGSYERGLVQSLGGVGSKILRNGPGLLLVELPEAFFNETMTLHLRGHTLYASVPFTLLIVLGAALVTRRQPLWGLQVFILSSIMLMLSDVPRYYLMVLPTLWLGYVLAPLLLTARFSPRVRDVTLFLLFSVANFQNIGGIVRLCLEQHTPNFEQSYKRDRDVPLRQMAAMLKSKMKPGETAIGPNAQLLAYWSGRDVVNGRLLTFESTPVSKWPQRLADAGPDYLVGPLDAYEAKDKEMQRLIAVGVVVPGRMMGWTPDHQLWLCRAGVKPPTTAGDWRKLPAAHRVRPAEKPPQARPHRTPEETARRTVKAARARKAVKAARAAKVERDARNQRKLRRQRRESATRPVAWFPLPVSRERVRERVFSAAPMNEEFRNLAVHLFTIDQQLTSPQTLSLTLPRSTKGGDRSAAVDAEGPPNLWLSRAAFSMTRRTPARPS